MALAARVGAALGLVSVRTRGHALGNFHGSSDDVGRLAAFFRDALEEKARPHRIDRRDAEHEADRRVRRAPPALALPPPR